MHDESTPMARFECQTISSIDQLIIKSSYLNRLEDGQLSTLYASLPSFMSFGVASVMMTSVLFRSSCFFECTSVLLEDWTGGRFNVHWSISGDQIDVLHILDQTCIVSTSGSSSMMGPLDRWSSFFVSV